MQNLDTTLIQTVEQLNQSNIETYADANDPQWLRYTNGLSVSAQELDRITDLSRNPNSKYKLKWSMGDLYLINFKDFQNHE